jgi:hypothetical protein
LCAEKSGRLARVLCAVRLPTPVSVPGQQAASPIKQCRETCYSVSLSGTCGMACAERRGTVTYHPANPATRLIDVAMITAPSGNDSHACRSAVRRICLVWMSVSETWNVMPIVKDR